MRTSNVKHQLVATCTTWLLVASLMLQPVASRAQAEVIAGSLLLAAVRWTASFIVSYIAGKILDELLLDGHTIRLQLRQRERELIHAGGATPGVVAAWELSEVRGQLSRMHLLLERMPDRATIDRVDRENRAAHARLYERLSSLESTVERHGQSIYYLESDVHELQAQVAVAFSEIDRLRAAMATPSFYSLRLGEFASIMGTAGMSHADYSGRQGSFDETTFLPGLVLRYGLRWQPGLAVAIEATGTAFNRDKFSVGADSTVGAHPVVTEWRGTLAANLYVTLPAAFPLTVYGGPCIEVIGAEYRAPAVGAGSSDLRVRHSEGFGFAVGVGFDWQRTPWSGVSTFVRYHRTFDVSDVYGELVGRRGLRERWSVLAGGGWTFNLE